jgi:CheY-specific phosphatase CheX
MEESNLSIDLISKIFLEVTKSTLEKSTKQDITFSPIIQKIPKVKMKPDMTCFVEFHGDYNGLIVINFSEEAAVDIYKNYMTTMGMPEDEIDNSFASPEISDSIGEITNQIMGQVTKEIDETFKLNALFGQPKALSLNSSIALVIDAEYGENRRLSFRVGNYSFRIEIAMEKVEFIGI